MEQRLNQAQLAARLNDAKTKVTVGARYEHYKKLTYVVIDIALLEATNEPCVIYQAEYGEHITFIRPVRIWIETVDVNGVPTPRFRRLDG
jgi:hypothetical protein